MAIKAKAFTAYVATVDYNTALTRGDNIPDPVSDGMAFAVVEIMRCSQVSQKSVAR